MLLQAPELLGGKDDSNNTCRVMRGEHAELERCKRLGAEEDTNKKGKPQHLPNQRLILHNIANL